MRGTRSTAFAAALVVSACGNVLAAPSALSPWSAASGPQAPMPWQISGLPHQQKPFTRFTVERDGNEAVLRIEADRSYGNLVHRLAPTRDAHRLSWRWKLDQPNPQADVRERSTEDEPLRVCALFDLPLERIPLVERGGLEMARDDHGRLPPGATVCYLWDGKLPPGTVVHSPFTDRIRFIVLRGPESAPGRWLPESRDLDADFRHAFGDESDQVPPLVGVAVGADADNTQAHTVAHVGAIQLAP